MNRKLTLLMVCLVILTCGSLLEIVAVEISVGVKESDWIEYQVTFTGAVPEEHNVEWAKFEILAVVGKTIDVNITSRYSDGTEETLPSTLNLETGQIGDSFIIPANLNSGDTFLAEYEDTITIKGVEKRIYAGAKRSIVYATTPNTMYYWDRATGVLVEGISSYPEFTLNTKVEKTNMWQPQIFGLDPFVLIVLIIIALVAISAIFIILRKNSSINLQLTK